MSGAPRLILRAEGLAVLVAATWAYGTSDLGWWLYAVLLLAPDLFMLGYLAGPRLGARVYNLGHTYLTPLALIAVGHLAAVPLAVALGLIWCAHIGLDRAVGYGLKYPWHFRATHLSQNAAGG